MTVCFFFWQPPGTTQTHAPRVLCDAGSLWVESTAQHARTERVQRTHRTHARHVCGVPAPAAGAPADRGRGARARPERHGVDGRPELCQVTGLGRSAAGLCSAWSFDTKRRWRAAATPETRAPCPVDHPMVPMTAIRRAPHVYRYIHLFTYI